MKVGLVFAGGGSRGAYEIGVWKAIKELGIDKHVSCVSGTSIGALNAMLFLYNDYELAEEIWQSLTKEKILPVNEKELILKGILYFLGAKNINFVKRYLPNLVKGGSISRDGLNDILQKLDFNQIRNSSVHGYAACTMIPEMKPKYFNINKYSEENIKRILYATSAVPLIYDSQKVENIDYLDGAIVDNVPIQPIYGEGCNIIIVVELSKEEVIDKSLYPNANIIELVYNEANGGNLIGMLDFDVNTIRKRIAKGYMDGIYTFKPLMDLTRMIDKAKKKDNNIFKSLLKKEIK